MRRLTDTETVPVMLAAGLTPLEPYPGSGEPWLCRHECGREVKPQYSNIQQGGGGCSVCTGPDVDPAIVMATMAAAGLKPLTPYPGAHKPWRCRHECGREVQPWYTSIQQGRGGCLVCAGKKVDPEIVMATMVAAGLTPLVPYPGNNEPWLCRHACGRDVEPRYTGIQQGQGGCLVCAGKEVDLEIAMSEMLAAGFTPLTQYPGAHKPWRCRHECGREVRPHYSNIQQNRGGCRFCVPRGYNPSKPGHVYLIELDSHPNFQRGVVKIGIAGGKSQRLKQWQQQGWTLLDVFHFDDGAIPLAIEDEVLEWFNENLGLEPCLSHDDVGYMGGFTETISVADLTKAGVTVADVRKKVKQLVKKQIV